MTNANIISFGRRHQLNPDQIVAFELVKKFTSLYEDVKAYQKEVFNPSGETLTLLIQKDLLICSDPKNPTISNCIVNPYLINVEFEMTEEMGEELWSKYPAALPLSGGGMFIARKGPDKYEVLKLYLSRINYNPEKHQYVLKQLEVYVKLVLDSKINGHRIHDWISNEMWDIIPALSAGARGEFKTDI